MLKQEFEKLTGLDLTDNEFEMVNAIYMLSENETKQEFAMRFAKINKVELLSACAQVLLKYRKKDEQQFKEIGFLKDVLMDIAVYLHKGEFEKTISLIKNLIGRKEVIIALWRNKVRLTSTDIDDLIDIVQKSDFE